MARCSDGVKSNSVRAPPYLAAPWFGSPQTVHGQCYVTPMLLLMALACLPTPTPQERCQRCAPDAQQDAQQDCSIEDAAACRELAEVARIADPVDANASLAYGQRACANGDGQACAALGLRYEDGLGTADDDAKALELFDHACELGAANGCFNAGLMYLSGHGVARNDGTAQEWFSQANALWSQRCDTGDTGDTAGCVKLGMLYEQGFGVPENRVKALTLYDMACAKGQTPGCMSAATLRLAGPDGESASAVTAIRKACDEGSPQGCGTLGQLYVTGGHGIEVDTARAQELLERACHAGDAQGCTMLAGMLTLDQGVPPDPVAAAWYGARACDLGGSAGCLANGMVAETRSGAENWLSRACGMGNAEGCMALGSVRMTRGEGYNPSGAASAIASACQLGLSDGCTLLQTLGLPPPAQPAP